MARLLVLIAVLTSLGVPAAAEVTLPPDALTPKLKVVPAPPLQPNPLPLPAPPPASSAACPCQAPFDAPIYENNVIVGYKRIWRPTGQSGPQCCR